MKQKCFLLALILVGPVLAGVTVRENKETITTYPFGPADPVPVITRTSFWNRAEKIYPYSYFDSFSARPIQKDWTVVRIENPYIEVSIMPEIGGKVWGVKEKSTGKEFIYTNDSVKFREIALRGPWTSGGIEFNFGLVGHTCNTSTPVDYIIKRNSDGSASCFVGGIDFCSRSRWTVEIKVPKDKAYFETKTFYYNPTELNQSCYAWSNSAVKVSDDFEVIYPGKRRIGHDYSEPLVDWPIDENGIDISWYKNNYFGTHKSYFIFGEMKEFLGCYWHNDDFGSGHWSLYDDMAGQKLWLWALSREGGIWEDLLTDYHGQYGEIQTGRYFNQNDHGFLEPAGGGRWREVWFPYKDIGPMVQASEQAVLNVERQGDKLDISVCALERIDEILTVVSDGKERLSKKIKLKPMEVFETTVTVEAATDQVEINIGDKLRYTSDKTSNDLNRPIDFHEIDTSSAEGRYLEGLRQEKWRGYAPAMELYLACLKEQPKHIRAMCRVAELYVRKGMLPESLAYAQQALKEDMYDAEANYIYGVIAARTGKYADAKDTFGWAAKSMQYRSAAYCRIAEIYIRQEDWPKALMYADRSLEYNVYNIVACQSKAIALRKSGDKRNADRTVRKLLEIDPLNHIARYEAYLTSQNAALYKQFKENIRNEYVAETYVEMGVYYAGLGLAQEAAGLFELAGEYPTAAYWQGYILRKSDPAKAKKLLEKAENLPTEFVFPFREETIPVLQWAIDANPDGWKATYYLGLLYYSKDRIEQAQELLNSIEPKEFATFYLVRANLNGKFNDTLAEADFQRAVEIDMKNWRCRHHLIEYYLKTNRPAEALTASVDALKQFPEQTALEVDLIRSLCANRKWAEALKRLEGTSILPFEGASDIHRLYARCHVLMAAEAMKNDAYHEAIKHLDESREYPERLGTGKPFQPDHRMQDYLEAICQEAIGNAGQAEIKRKQVIEYTLKNPDDTSENAFFGKKALRCYGDKEMAEKINPQSIPDDSILDVIIESEKAYNEMAYDGTGQWDQEAMGNHRVLIHVGSSAKAVRVHIPWRRSDKNVTEKAVILTDSTGRRIKNIVPYIFNRESGDFIFEPAAGPGDYYLYYMPYTKIGSYYPQVHYLKADFDPDAAWLDSCGLTNDYVSAETWNSLASAKAVQMQSVDAFNSFYPMEIIATAEETEIHIKRSSPAGGCLLFPEHREYPIRMTDDLPLRWVNKKHSNTFTDTAMRGEFFVMQIGVYACKNAIESIDVDCGDLRHSNGSGLIPADAVNCFNTEGVNWDGTILEKKCSVANGKVRAMWFGIDIPADAEPGIYTGLIGLRSRGEKLGDVKLELTIRDDVLADRGDSEPWRHSRLRWLDSRIAADDDVVKPFTAMNVTNRTVSCLGRAVTIGENGFPCRIESYFSPDVTHLTGTPKDILSGPIVLKARGEADDVKWKTGEFKFTAQKGGVVRWRSQNSAETLEYRCTGEMEFDGYCKFVVEVAATEDISLRDIILEIPLNKSIAKYMMGMGRKGGLRPESFHWRWDPANNQDSAWLGDTCGGLQFGFRDDAYERPLNTNFYSSKPLVMPASWSNNGNGGCSIRPVSDSTMLVTAFSGPRKMRKGDKLYYNFHLLVTPFKTLDTKAQWRTRFYHDCKPVDEVAKTGANTLNIHHATEINPFINYPFLRTGEMKAYISWAREEDMKVKIYYTVRELSNRAPELFSLRSLDDEILSFGPGGGYSWLQEHLGDNYIPAWYVDQYKDAAVINSGNSRWHNYYLEGLNWLVKNAGIDGIYIDDVAFDRTVMKRVRKILDRGNDGAMIDLHSANQFNAKDGFVNSANLYLEHFPYIDRLWFGEYFDYDLGPDYWLVEVSGIPFGVMGEMLQDNGNPWRGMVYGMTARMPRTEMPAKLWKIWDQFGIQDSEMIGYYSDNCPVKTSHANVAATVYKKADKSMIAIASWEDRPVQCKLDIDWASLGLDEEQAVLRAPEIEGFQHEAEFLPSEEITVQPGKGWLLILTHATGKQPHIL
ncbi:MAG: DUF6067 family protein [Planctomycetales bacterium]|nr:DUF6067 family protein [Planctomycetales bacterium]